MKKNREASDLAARLAAAAQQPAGMSSVPILPPAALEPAEKPVAKPVVQSTKSKKAKAKEPQTMPITLRPDSALWNKFVLKASERTREEGRVISAQQIMLETLERSDV